MERFKNKSRPLAFVGKGVCFDTEDIIETTKFMEDMTYDMAGSSSSGLMKNLAMRKAK